MMAIMPGSLDGVLAALLDLGFAKLSGVLSQALVERLQAAGARLAGREAQSWSAATEWYVNAKWKPTYFADPGQSANLYDCLGVDPQLDAAIEAVLATPMIRELLDRMVGVDRRLWFVQLRWAVPNRRRTALSRVRLCRRAR